MVKMLFLVLVNSRITGSESFFPFFLSFVLHKIDFSVILVAFFNPFSAKIRHLEIFEIL